MRCVALALALSLGAVACSPVEVSTPPTHTGGLGGGAPAATQSAAYVDAFATGALSHITSSGWATPTIVLIGFADPTTSATSTTVAGALSIASGFRSSGKAGNLTFLSIGGADVVPASWPQPAATLAANLVAQINTYNISLTGNNQVAGIDLDLENGFSAATIAALAQALHGQTLANGKALLVSSAPQVVGVNGVNVDATNATNLGFSPGGLNDNYGQALANNDIDYALAQSYNTGPTGIVLNNVATANGTIVQGVDEANPVFFMGIAQAMNSVVRASCSLSAALCIPSSTKIFVGEPANQGSGGTYTVFNPSAPQTPPIPYNQASILATLAAELTYMRSSNPTPYANVTGVSMWALGNDYAPNLYNDTYAAPGAFSTAMFGASPAPAGPSILLQLTNNGSSGSITTLITNGNYYPFPAVAAGGNATWCTQAATGTYGCTDSSILDTLGAGTFTVQVTTGGTAWLCPAGNGLGTGGSVTLTGGRYNLQVNGDFDSCAFGSF